MDKVEKMKNKLKVSISDCQKLAKEYPHSTEHYDGVIKGLKIAEEYFLRYFSPETLKRREKAFNGK